MKTLKESLLDDIETTLTSDLDEIVKSNIIKQLRNTELYYVNPHMSDDKLFNIYKNRGKWKVDVNSFITCMCTDDGYLTDGSFSFHVIKGAFYIESKNCKSLEYGPTTVYEDLHICDCKDLKDLKNCPRTVGGDIFVKNTGITSLKYFPGSCRNVYIMNNDNLKNLKGVKPCRVQDCIIAAYNGFTSDAQMFKEIEWITPSNMYNVHRFDGSPLLKYIK